MTIHLPGHDGAEIGLGSGSAVHPSRGAINQRHENHFRSAKRHSLIVGFLKGAMPVLALCLIAWFALATLMSGLGVENITVKSTGISNGKLIMESPKMNGYNKNNKPYDLVAKRAIQDLKTPNIIQLEQISAKIPLETGDFANVEAKAGTYNSDQESLSLRQDILVVSEDGTEIKLDTAEIDLKTGGLISNTPVTVDTPTTTIQADRLEVVDNGAIIVFTQRVQVTIQPATTENQQHE